MTQLRSLSAPFTAAALFLALSAPRLAYAASECESSGDCQKGFECRDVGGSDCGAPAPACPPGSTCPEVEPEPCEPVTQLECVPAQCTSDAQCGVDMVCFARNEGTCASSDCACAKDEPDCACDTPVCNDVIVSYCTPKYLLPCEAAADCGSSFNCEPQESCGCSGSSGAGGGADPAPNDAARPLPPDDGDAAPSPQPDPDCSCEPTGTNVCVPQQIECDADSECPTGWVCESQGDSSAPGCAGEGCGALPTPEPAPSKSYCFPRHYGDVGVDLDNGAPTSGGDDKGTGSGTQNPEAASNDDSSESSSSCQMGNAPASQGALGILALLGAVVGLGRRRAQRRG